MMRRRRYLEGAGLVGTIVLAGCVDESGSEGTEATESQPEEEAGTADTQSDDDSPDGESSEEEETTIDEHEEIDRGELEALTRAAIDEEIEAASGPDAEGVVTSEETNETNETHATEEGADQPDRAEETDEDQPNEGESDGNDENDGAETDATGTSDGQESSESTDIVPQASDYRGTIRAQVDYDGDWVLAYSTRDRTSSFTGTELRTVKIDDDLDVVSVAVQKVEDDDAELTALVLLDGGIVADGATAEPFGIAEATHSVH